MNTINTSRNHIPAIFNKLVFESNQIIVNFGCGKYPQNVSELFSKQNIIVVNYDPNYDGNERVFKKFENLLTALKKYDKNYSLVCIAANVLNVLTPDEYDVVIGQLRQLSAVCSDVFVGVYEGSKSGIGEVTRDGYQSNKPIGDYLSDFTRLPTIYLN